MIVTAEEFARIRRQAEAEYPNECCGVILVGDGPGAERTLLPCRNIQNELHARDPVRYPRDARTAYNISLDDFRRIDELESEGFRIRTFYHSHVDAEAYFSETDKRHAAPPPRGEPLYPDAIYLVLAVFDRQARDARAFRWDSGQGDFLPVSFEAP